MKKTSLLILMMAALPWMVSAQNPGDDIYFVPKKQKEKKEVRQDVGEMNKTVNRQSVKQGVPTVVVRDAYGRTRDVDEYNRRNYVSGKNDFSFHNDTLYIDEHLDSDLPGNWVNKFEGTQDDYEYAVRLIRFRDPAYAIPVSSPLYWDVVYGTALFPSWNWNVYDDGMYAYVFPTYSNRLWWDWRFDSWNRWNYWRWSTHYYAWGGYWGDPYWGWHHHFHPHYYHPHYYHPHYGGGHIASISSRHRRNPNYSTLHRPTYRPGNSRRPTTIGNRGGYTRPSIGRDYGTQSRPTATGRVVRPSRPGVNNGVRPNSSYTRPSISRPRSMEYTRPSSTRSSGIERSRPVRSERPSVERRSSGRSSYDSSRSSGNNNRRPTVNGNGRSRR